MFRPVAVFANSNKMTGELIWRGLEDGGGMNGSAFSSPVIATVAGKKQAIVQTRSSLCGVDLETGKTLWTQDIPTFRGMNIITPTLYDSAFLTSAYGGTTQLIGLVQICRRFQFVTTMELAGTRLYDNACRD